MRVVIVDDEPLARRGLAARLAREEDVQILGEFGDGISALQHFQHERADVAFVDMEMPGMDGLELANNLVTGSSPPRIVFVTAHEHYAIDAFACDACDYLLKPVTGRRLTTTLERLRARMQPEDTRPQWLVYSEEGATHRVPVTEIRRIEAAGDYMVVHASDRTHVVRRAMKALLRELGPEFVRVHRSHAVSKRLVRGYASNPHGDGEVILDGDDRVRCSRTYRAAVVEILATTQSRS